MANSDVETAKALHELSRTIEGGQETLKEQIAGLDREQRLMATQVQEHRLETTKGFAALGSTVEAHSQRLDTHVQDDLRRFGDMDGRVQTGGDSRALSARMLSIIGAVLAALTAMAAGAIDYVSSKGGGG